MTKAKAPTPYGRGNRANTRAGPIVEADPAPGDRVMFTRWSCMVRPFQENVLASSSGIDFVIAGLGAGKSRVGGFKFVRWVMKNPRRANGEPTNWLVLGKDFRMVKRAQFKVLLGILRTFTVGEERIVKKVTYGQEPVIELWNGVTIMAFSGKDHDATRSHEFDGVWVDEAEYMDMESFVVALSRLRNAAEVRCVVTSSPDGAGWIYPLLDGEYPEFDEMRLKSEIRVFRARSIDNPSNRPEVLAALAAGMNAVRKDLAKQELGGRFLGTKEAPGSGAIEYVRGFCGKVEVGEVDETHARSVGVDLGKTEDFTWFSALSPKGVTLAMDRFNLNEIDKTAEEYWTYVAHRLIEFCEKIAGPDLTLVIDAARGGDHFASNVRTKIEELGLAWTVVEYATDAHGRKAEAVESCGMGISLGRLVVPTSWTFRGEEHVVDQVERLRLEFKKLKVQNMPGGKRRFDHPPGGHDDGVVSLSLAYHGLGLEPARRESPLPVWE